jgi:hypothetical protein
VTREDMGRLIEAAAEHLTGRPAEPAPPSSGVRRPRRPVR